MSNILIVEDDADIREILSFNIENAGYGVLTADSAEAGLELAGKAQLILLDVMLPGMNGFQMARVLRTECGSSVPIIFLTARGEENDLLTGFSSGGDDYISKPFSVVEVLARVKAVLGRAAPQKPQDFAAFGAVVVDFGSRTASLNGVRLPLSRKEYDLLELLARHPDSYFTRSMIIDALWQEAPYVLDRTVDVHIARIRAKLGARRDLIKNKTGFGYYLDSNEK